ncbi:hypothetical protein Esti_003067 [Eimeria stiedai]
MASSLFFLLMHSGEREASCSQLLSRPRGPGPPAVCWGPSTGLPIRRRIALVFRAGCLVLEEEELEAVFAFGRFSSIDESSRFGLSLFVVEPSAAPDDWCSRGPPACEEALSKNWRLPLRQLKGRRAGRPPLPAARLHANTAEAREAPRCLSSAVNRSEEKGPVGPWGPLSRSPTAMRGPRSGGVSLASLECSETKGERTLLFAAGGASRPSPMRGMSLSHRRHARVMWRSQTAVAVSLCVLLSAAVSGAAHLLLPAGVSSLQGPLAAASLLPFCLHAAQDLRDSLGGCLRVPHREAAGGGRDGEGALRGLTRWALRPTGPRRPGGPSQQCCFVANCKAVLAEPSRLLPLCAAADPRNPDNAAGGGGAVDATATAAAGDVAADAAAAARAARAAQAARNAAAAASLSAALEPSRSAPLVEADLPWDRVLERRYPSFQDEATKLPPRGLGALPVRDVPEGSPPPLPSSLGEGPAGVGPLGKGGYLWNALGQDQTELERAANVERQFVEERWMRRLAEVHKLSDQHCDAVREQQAEKLKKISPPKWVLPVSKQEVEAPAPLFFDFQTYGPHFEAYVEATQDRVITSELAFDETSGSLEETHLKPSSSSSSSSSEESSIRDSRSTSRAGRHTAAAANVEETGASPRTSSGFIYGPSRSGFRLKQITAPIAHRQGLASFFYFHSPHSAPFVPFINACRRESFGLPRPAVTALKIENLDSYVDAPANKPPPPSYAPQLQQQQQQGQQQQQQQQKGISPSAYLTRLPVEVGMCVVGMREDVEDLVENLRKIVFRRRQPKGGPSSSACLKGGGSLAQKGSFDNPWVASLSVKGPIAAVAGDLVLPEELEVVNKSQYLCFMNSNYYLNLKVKIEEIEEFVLPEFGYESLNRDIDAEGFFYFPSYCSPVPVFGFEAQRVPEAFLETPDPRAHASMVRTFNASSFEELQQQRFGRSLEDDPVLQACGHCLPKQAPAGVETHRSSGDKHVASCPAQQSEAHERKQQEKWQQQQQAQQLQEESGLPRFPFESLGEVVTIELHTDGSATPRQAFLETLGRVEELAASACHALVKNCKESRDGSVEEEFEDPDMYQDRHRQARIRLPTQYIGVPWNRYKDSLARTVERHKTFFSKDMLRQYSPVKEQLLARREQFGVEADSTRASSTAGRPQQQHEKHLLPQPQQPQQRWGETGDWEERLLDEEELEEELVRRSPTIRLEREREYQATLKLVEDIEAAKAVQERGDGEGLPKFPIKHKGLEDPPDWVFEDFMAQRVPIGMGWGFTND